MKLWSNIMASTFNEQLRQKFLEEDFYFKAVNDNLEIIKHGQKSKAEDPNWYSIIYLSSLYAHMMYLFTVGEPIENIENYLDEIATSAQLAKKLADKDDSLGMIYSTSMENEELPNILGLCILFNRADCLAKINEAIYQNTPDDAAVDALISLLLPDHPISTEGFERPFKFRKSLLQAIQAKTEKDTLKHLNTYLSKWYDALRSMNWPLIDSHLDQDPNYGGYYGYWAFEAAAVAYMKNIDDTSLRDYLYYPKDMVDYAREQHPVSELQQTKRIEGAMLWGGKEAIYTGKWICPMMPANAPNRVRHFKKGDILPEGRSEKGNYVWYYLREES